MVNNCDYSDDKANGALQWSYQGFFLYFHIFFKQQSEMSQWHNDIEKSMKLRKGYYSEAWQKFGEISKEKKNP